jgi:3-methyladenine DNA glycosylase AlkD
LADCERLLDSDYTDERLLALLSPAAHYQKEDEDFKERVCRPCLKERARVNNRNLMDSSAPYITGPYLFRRDRPVLYKLARSRSLWDRRIAILATFAFIRAGDFGDTFKLTENLPVDEHDPMNEACGRRLREVGKRNRSMLEAFLRQHHGNIPRTILRYSLE